MCTNLLLTVPSIPDNGGPPSAEIIPQYISARTMEFAEPLNTSLYLVPQGQKFPLSASSKSTPWTGTYGFVGVAFTPSGGNGNLVFVDGINQQGLSCAGLWLPGTQYLLAASPGTTPVEFFDFCAWVMSQFDNVGDVATALQQISVISSNAEAGQEAPLHFITSDSTGASLVVEIIGGAIQMYPPSPDEPVPAAAAGVLTNAPTYDWQCTNLINYLHLSLVGSATGTSAEKPSVGSTLLGLPGDPMSSSRFIRACAFREGINKLLPADGKGWLPAPPQVGGTGSTQTMVNVAIQLVQMIQATPYATSLVPAQPTPTPPSSPWSPYLTVGDWTLWQVARDHTNQVFYFSNAFNSTLQAVNLNAVNFGGGSVSPSSSLKSIPVLPAQGSWYVDASSSFA